MRRLHHLYLQVVCQLPPGHLCDVIEASSQDLPRSRAEGLLGLAISPYLIVTAVVAGAAGVAITDSLDLPLWLVLVASTAGWSSAWSP